MCPNIGTHHLQARHCLHLALMQLTCVRGLLELPACVQSMPGLSLDELRTLLPGIIAAAASEQNLENKMMLVSQSGFSSSCCGVRHDICFSSRIAAFREPAMEDLMLDYLERLRQIGFSTVVGRAWNSKQCLASNHAVMHASSVMAVPSAVPTACSIGLGGDSRRCAGGQMVRLARSCWSGSALTRCRCHQIVDHDVVS